MKKCYIKVSHTGNAKLYLNTSVDVLCITTNYEKIRPFDSIKETKEYIKVLEKNSRYKKYLPLTAVLQSSLNIDLLSDTATKNDIRVQRATKRTKSLINDLRGLQPHLITIDLNADMKTLYHLLERRFN